MTAEMKELLQHAKQNEDQIVKIQSRFRGYKARKDNTQQEAQSSHRSKQVKGGRGAPPPDGQTIKLGQMTGK
jgi:hypothetical protein